MRTSHRLRDSDVVVGYPLERRSERSRVAVEVREGGHGLFAAVSHEIRFDESSPRRSRRGVAVNPNELDELIGILRDVAGDIERGTV